MTQRAAETTENSLEKIKRQLASASGRNLLQGPLLKRSETVIHALPLSQYLFIISRSNFTLFSPLLFSFPDSNCYFFRAVLIILQFQCVLFSCLLCNRLDSNFVFVTIFVALIVKTAFVFTAEKMERALGDLGPDNGENGIQVCLCILVSLNARK